MRASRLVSVLLLLQARGRMTAQQLADELEVSLRTIYRDVESLAAAGIPLYGEAGHRGGYQLIDGFRTRLTGLTAEEADSLFLTGLPTAAAELGLGSVVLAAQLKLMAALPAHLRVRAGRIAESFYLDAPSWYRNFDEAPHLTAVAQAIWQQQLIRIHYVRWARPQEITRTVEPHGLVLKAGSWYLVAYCGTRQGTYRISRILALDLLDKTFDRRPGFDLARSWHDYLAHFDSRREFEHAVLRLSPAGFARLSEIMEPAIVRAARESAVRDTDGWVRVTVPVDRPAEALATIFRLGADAEIVAPEVLRDQMRQTVAALTSLYE